MSKDNDRGQRVTNPSNHHGEEGKASHGVTNANLKKYGRNLARAKNQMGSKASGRGR